MKSKRFQVIVYTMVAYMAIGVAGFLVHPEHITELGSFFALTSIPLIAWITGETVRPSGTLLNNTKHAKQNDKV